ncbi:hypothetical protein ABPG74_006055 [Tetrahymena malaccensis]
MSDKMDKIMKELDLASGSQKRKMKDRDLLDQEQGDQSKEIMQSADNSFKIEDQTQKKVKISDDIQDAYNINQGGNQHDGVLTEKIGEQIVFINLEENKQQYQNKPVEIDDFLQFEEKLDKKDADDGDLNIEPVIGKQADEQKVAPWASLRTLRIKNPLLRLHNEIIELTDYLSPTKQEHEIRLKSMERLKKILLDAVPECEVKTFGSFSTELYLPNSDIDMVIVKDDIQNKQLYKKVADKIMNCEDIYENINLVTNAKVPIIKFVEKETQINFDISFNKEDGVKQLSEVKKGLELYPEMRYLIMVMKCVLRQRDLHETYSGGIGSFLLFCMILAFLRDLRKQYEKENRVQEIQNITLGEYLLKMFKFYGFFDVDNKRIIMHEGGAIVEKDIRDKRFSLLSPQDPTHDIGNSSFKIKEQVFPLFKNRFQFFTNYNFKQGESTLKYLVNPSNSTFTFQKEDK